MEHHAVDLGLCKFIERKTLRENQPDELVISLHGALLVRRAGITVEDLCAKQTILTFFNGGGVAELAAVVGQQDRKQARKHILTEAVPERTEFVLNTGGSTVFTEESQHQFCLGEDQCKEHFAADGSVNCVPLNDRSDLVLEHEPFIVLVFPTNATFGIDLGLAGLRLSELQATLALLIQDTGGSCPASSRRAMVRSQTGSSCA